VRLKHSGLSGRSEEEKEPIMKEYEDLIELLILVCTAVLVVASALYVRYRKTELRHRERMLALEKGMPLPADPPEPSKAPWHPRVYLLRGLMWLFTGIAVSALFLGAALTTVDTETQRDKLINAMTYRKSGMAEEDVQTYLKLPPRIRPGVPLGWAFTGLVPAGVGLAYLIFYRSEGRKMLE
jgi:hypothetical protein